MDAFGVERRDKALYINFKGEITLEITTDIKKRIDATLKEPGFEAVVIDLSQITFIDSSGIGFLVALNTRVMGQGKKLYLFRPSAQVVKTLELVQLANFFQTVKTDEELAAALPA
jgi:anti-sigma B factor antagonist